LVRIVLVMRRRIRLASPRAEVRFVSAGGVGGQDVADASADVWTAGVDDAVLDRPHREQGVGLGRRVERVEGCVREVVDVESTAWS
jgi:hypothetical protein